MWKRARVERVRNANKPPVVTVICKTTRLGIDLLIAAGRQWPGRPLIRPARLLVGSKGDNIVILAGFVLFAIEHLGRLVSEWL